MSYPQPGTPYASIYFGGNNVTAVGKPTLQSFEYERSTTKGSNRARFTLVDEHWTMLERLLTEGGTFSFDYGWAESSTTNGGPGQDRWWSDRYELALQKYQIRVCNEHVELTAEGKTFGNVLRKEAAIMQYNTNKDGDTNYNIEDGKRNKDLGWSLEVDPSDDNPPTASSHNGTLFVPRKNNLMGITPRQDTIQTGVHAATYDKGKSGGYYRFYEDGPDFKYVVKQRTKPVRRRPNKYYTIPNMKGSNYDVVSFEPDFNLPAMLGGDNQKVRSIIGTNPTTGENLVTSVDQQDNSNPRLSAQLYGGDLRTQKGDNCGGREWNAERCGSEEEIRRANVAFYNNRSIYVNRATLVLVGDPDYKLCDEIEVVVFETGKSTGLVHYTSGKWLVVGIKDTISPGNFLTTLTLKKLSTLEQPPNIQTKIEKP